MGNHAAAPQGRAGWKCILQVTSQDLGSISPLNTTPSSGEGDLVAHRMTMHGTHRASTMPLVLARRSLLPGPRASWPEHPHLAPPRNDQIVEHWACRDDIGLLTELGGGTPRT